MWSQVICIMLRKMWKFPRNFICEKPSRADIHCTCKVKNSTFQLFCRSPTPLCLRWDPFRSKFIPWSWREGKDAINIPCANIYSGKAHTCKGLKLSCNKYQNQIWFQHKARQMLCKSKFSKTCQYAQRFPMLESKFQSFNVQP